MKDLLILVSAIAIWVVIGKLLAQHYIKKGKTIWISRFIGIVTGLVVAFVFLMIVIPKTSQPTTDTPTANSAPVSTETQPQNNPVTTETVKPVESKKPVEAEKPAIAEQQPEPKQEPEPEQTPSVDKAVTTFDMTPDVFAKRMNRVLKEVKSPFKVKVNVENGKVTDTFVYNFNDNLSILGAVDKTSKNLISVTLITRGDGTAKSGMDVIAIVTAAYTAVIGEDKQAMSEAAKIFIKLTDMQAKNNNKRGTVSTLFNGTSFSFMSSDVMGNWFSAEAR